MTPDEATEFALALYQTLTMESDIDEVARQDVEAIAGAIHAAYMDGAGSKDCTCQTCTVARGWLH